MKNMLFRDFIDGQFDEEDHQLYILSDTTGRVLYVGFSRTNIWNRWFISGSPHMYKTRFGDWRGASSIGRYIVETLPESLGYHIRLLTLEDSRTMVSEELRSLGWNNADIRACEALIIRKTHPVFNIHHNLAPSDNGLLSIGG